MSAPEPGWLVSVREEVDRAEAGGWWWTHQDGSRSFVLARPVDPRFIEGARQLLAAHDQLRVNADRMADALAALAASHITTNAACVYCKGTDWVDDENWSTPYPTSKIERAPYAGLLPCPAHEPGEGTQPRCEDCYEVWPCSTARAAEALRAYRDTEEGG